ncbi:unnamed protein product [Hydatigera taeniaeformis]|uniref:Uncharacterized protein n=1 Tax=Hydatigena taeniaeformis TaxID=6205 RepID=A0A0R3WVM9_HYDTA|nr:unnamed protein product [Hydatigera taeniaeformis]
MSGGNIKPGPAAGDSETRNAPVIETFVNRESELGTLSEPRPATLQVNALITPVQHRQSMPYEGVSARLADHPQSTRIFSGVHVTPAHLTGQASINVRETPSTQFGQNQQNNNMLFQKSTLHVQLTGVKQNRRIGPKTNILQHYSIINGKDICLLNQISPLHDFPNSAGTCRTMLRKTVVYRKAHAFCLSTSIVALVPILLESCFLLASLYIKNNCAIIASFVSRTAVLSIIIVLLELTKSSLQKVKLSKSTASYSSNTASIDFPTSRNGFEMCTKKGLALPVLILSSSVDCAVDRRRCDEKTLLTMVQILLYLTLLVILFGAAVWLSLKRFDLLKHETFGNASSGSSPIIEPKKECSTSDINVGLFILVTHALLMTLRLVIYCTSSWTKGMCLLTAHRRSTAVHGPLFPLMEVPLPSLDHLPVFHQHAESGASQTFNR